MSRPSSERRDSFWFQLCAVLRARRAVSRQQRRDSPVAWAASRTLMTGLAVMLVASVFGLGVGASAREDTNFERLAVIFFGVPAVAAGYLIFGQLQNASQSHPLGPTRNLLPISRKRSALIGMCERTVAPSTLFVYAAGLAPWLGQAWAGESWLTVAGWTTVILFPLVPLAAREILLGIQMYVTEALRGLVPAAGGLVMTVVFVTMPFWIGGLLRRVDLIDVDPLALPILRIANSLGGPLLAAGAAALLGWLAMTLQSLTPPRHWRRGKRFGWRVALPSVRFEGARPELLMARMMIVQATRQPIYLYTMGLIAVLGTIAIIFPGAPGAGLLIITGYLGPASSMFNLYGGDAKHYRLWLATGRRLEEWTRARQLFSLAYVGVFGTAATAIMAASGFLGGAETFAYGIALVDAALIGLIAGPAVSRVVLTPAIPEAGTYGASMRGPRSFFGWASAGVSGAVGLAISLALVTVGLWWAALVVPVVLAVVALLARTDRGEWTPDLRLRMATSLR